jgi:hypothetical protein
MKKSEFEQAVKAREAKKKKAAKVKILETAEQEIVAEEETAPYKKSACDDEDDDNERGATEAAQGSEGGAADLKLGEIQLRPDSVLLVKKTNYQGSDRVDFRVWKNTATYKGPTKQGFVVTMEKLDEFFKIVDEMKKKLKS